jgi:hypothetical protein
MKDAHPISLHDFVDLTLDTVSTLRRLCEFGIRRPQADVANRLLDQLFEAFGDTPGLRERIEASRKQLIAALANPPHDKPLPLWVEQGLDRAPHLVPPPSAEQRLRDYIMRVRPPDDDPTE